MDSKLRNYHPQKYYLKIVCNLLYYFGVGDFWYEKSPRSDTRRKLYKIWSFIANAYIFLIIFDEILAHFRKDLCVKEKSDLILLTFGHLSIAAKILTIYVKRARIKAVLHTLLEEERTVYPSPEIDRSSVKRAMFYCCCLFCNIYIILISATIDGIRNHIEEGVPIRTEVTLYPTRNDTGLLINIMRFFIQLHWWFIISIMYCIDCLSICCLVFVSFKFRRVRSYFSGLRERLALENGKSSLKNLDRKFKEEFVIGIKLHQHALSCARNIQKSLGNLYSVQVTESIALLVVCLLKLLTVERDITSAVKNVTFISCIVILNGAYMMAGGDVTNEASLISPSIFHCGWEHAKAGPSLRSLLVITIQCSQMPVCMTAFGILSLSYESFITVLRLSYSFFAVMY